MRKIMYNWLDDILLLGGYVCIVYGLSLWNAAAAWIVGGLLLVSLAMLIGKAKAQNVDS